MLEKVSAPFTAEQVVSLNTYQVAGVMHPFTCGADGCHGIRLIAAEDGWRCARQTCDYRQDWAHAFMADWSWKGFSWQPQPNSVDVLAEEFGAHAEESLALANEAFDAVVETWPKG